MSAPDPRTAGATADVRPAPPHPYVDRSSPQVVLTETRATVAYLSEGRADLLVRCVEAGRRPLLVSDEVTRLTYPMREALLDARGAWVVRGIDGTLRDGIDGRRLDAVADAFTTPPPQDPADVAVRFLRPSTPQATQLVVSLSVRHKAAATTVLGATAELLATTLTGAPPTGWGLHEPAGLAWDRASITQAARERMPRDTTVVLAGSVAHPLSGTLRATRTAHGLEETTQLVLGVGAPGSPASAAAVASLGDVAGTLAMQQMPLFGLVMGRQGRADLTFGSVLEAPPVPLGLLLGPPGVRELALDVDDAVARLGARVVGRPRVPGLWFALGGPDQDGWAALDAVTAWLGPERVRAAFGVARPEGVWRASRQ